MASPVAQFSITFTLGSLVAVFTDTSTNTPTTWLWSFGAGVSGSLLNTQGPHTVTFPAEGPYTISLTVTNVDGSSSHSRTINLSLLPRLPLTIAEMVDAKLLGVVVTDEVKLNYIAQWQLYLQPLVEPEVTESNTFNETFWPPLANALVAYLAAYSCINDWGRALLMGSTTTGSSGGTTTTQSAGALKTLEVGPSKAEWHDNTERISNFFSTGSSGSFGAGSSPLDQLAREICALASRMSISLAMCPPLPKPVLHYRKAGRDQATTPWPDQPITAVITF